MSFVLVAISESINSYMKSFGKKFINMGKLLSCDDSKSFFKLINILINHKKEKFKNINLITYGIYFTKRPKK